MAGWLFLMCTILTLDAMCFVAYIIEFNRTTGETKYIPLVVVDGKVVMAAEEGE